jgi:hypothetical protein
VALGVSPLDTMSKLARTPRRFSWGQIVFAKPGWIFLGSEAVMF